MLTNIIGKFNKLRHIQI